MTLRISVIIPTFNEAAALPAALASVGGNFGGGDSRGERIVVDGGSTDATRKVAGVAERFILSSKRGRAAQINRGAAEAAGDVLLVLHADTRLSEGALEELREVMLQRANVVGGAFRLRIDSSQRRVRAVAWFVNLRSQFLRLPYGDQAIFVRRAAFEQLGGCADLPIGEDLDLVKRMKRLGPTVLLRSTATTSGRRWEQHGLIRTTLTNLLVLGGFAVGVGAPRIRRMYDWLTS